MQKFWALLFKTGHFEHDPAFKSVIHDISRKGMLAVGTLGATSVFINFVTNAIAGNMPAITYSDPGNSIVIWDKLLLLILSVSYIALSRSKNGAAWARPVGVGMAIAATLAIVLDDLGQNTVYSSGHYIGIIILLVVAAIPFQPVHAIIFDIVASATFVISSAVVKSSFDVEGQLTADVFVYLFIVFFLVVGISTLLYHTRYDEYRARKLAREAEEKVRALEQTKSEFFENVSHEFRTPLTLILGPVRDAIAGKYGTLDRSLENRLRVVDVNARHLQYLINELLDLASLEAGQLSLQIGPHNVDQILRAVTASFESLADEKNIELEYHTDNSDLEVYVDRHRLEQVATNLLANAFKFTPEGGRIRLSTQSNGDHLDIRFKDSGCGIDPADQPYIFDRFRKAHSTPGTTSTGIGLALVKELVELHKGTVDVSSDPGFGSEFVVSLKLGTDHLDINLLQDDTGNQEYVVGYPVYASDIVNSTASENADCDHTVLVIDDNADMRTYLAEILSQHYHIVTAENGVQGLEQARNIGPDLIVADVMMPEMDGLEFCRQARADSSLSHIPIILLTARASDDARREGLLTRADDYMTKPFNSTDLLIRAENLIEIRQALHHQYKKQAAVTIGPADVEVPSQDEAFLQQTNSIIEREMSNSYFSVDHLAEELGMSRRQLERRLKQTARVSPAGYVRMMRLTRASQLLEKNFGNVSLIAQEVGFQDPNYFSKLFKQTFGVPPSQYEGD